MPTGQLADSQSALGMLEREFDTVATGMFQSLMSLEDISPDLGRMLHSSLENLLSVNVQIVAKGRDHMLANRHLTAQVARLNEELTAGREFWRAFDTDQRARLIQLKEQQLETNSREADPHSVQDLREELSGLQRQLDDTQKLQERTFRLAEVNSKLSDEMFSLQIACRDLYFNNQSLRNELAGRIQQIQLLGKAKGIVPVNDKVYRRLTAELEVNSLKALAHHKHGGRQGSSKARRLAKSSGQTVPVTAVEAVPVEESNDAPPLVWHTRKVQLTKPPQQGLGLTIKGGSASSGSSKAVQLVGIRPETVAAACGQLFIGDHLLSCNSISFEGKSHAEVVALLVEQGPQVVLEVCSQVAEAALTPPVQGAAEATVTVAAKQAEQCKEHGNALTAAKDWSGAVNAYTQAIQLDPSVSAFFCNRSAAYLQLHALPEAIADAASAIELAPSCAKAWARLSAAHQAAGNLREARDAIFRAAELEEQSTEYHLLLEQAEKTLYQQVKVAMNRPSSHETLSSSAGSLTGSPFVTSQHTWSGLTMDVASIQDSDSSGRAPPVYNIGEQ